MLELRRQVAQGRRRAVAAARGGGVRQGPAGGAVRAGAAARRRALDRAIHAGPALLAHLRAGRRRGLAPAARVARSVRRSLWALCNHAC